METGLTAMGAFCAACVAAFFFPTLPPSLWPVLFFSSLCHCGYYISMAHAYETDDLSVSYTLMRGTAPLLTTLILLVFVSPLHIAALGGIGILCTGILLLAFDRMKGKVHASPWAFVTALWISAYTLMDGLGAQQCGNGASYAIWLFICQMVPIEIYLFVRFKKSFLVYARSRFFFGLGGGVASFLSYAIAIYAMTCAPIAIVAALRETSVLFGLLLAVFFLHETWNLKRTLAVIFVALGAMILKIF